MFVTVHNPPPSRAVIPAKAGIQINGCTVLRYWLFLDSRLRGNDGAGANGYENS